VNALANPAVGKYVNEYFSSAFQKVATFKVVRGQKQGGNVATYFCSPDGRVLHCVAGAVDANTLLREAQWVVETTKKAMEFAKTDGGKFKAYFRKAHADRLRNEHGFAVEPVTFDTAVLPGENDALSYRDPTGQPLAPILPPPPIDGPDVHIKAEQAKALRAVGGAELDAAMKAPGNLQVVRDRRGRGWALGNQGQVHVLMAAHSMTKIEHVYGTVFEGILGEKISTKPVEVIHPFPWHGKGKPGGGALTPADIEQLKLQSRGG
jgi:hypothetical protein